MRISTEASRSRSIASSLNASGSKGKVGPLVTPAPRSVSVPPISLATPVIFGNGTFHVFMMTAVAAPPRKALRSITIVFAPVRAAPSAAPIPDTPPPQTSTSTLRTTDVARAGSITSLDPGCTAIAPCISLSLTMGLLHSCFRNATTPTETPAACFHMKIGCDGAHCARPDRNRGQRSHLEWPCARTSIHRGGP